MIISKRVFVIFVLPLFLLYFLPNLYFGSIYVKDGYVPFEGEYFQVEYGFEYVVLYLFCFLLFFIFGFFGAFLGPKKEVVIPEIVWGRVYVFLIICCWLSIILTFSSGLNIAGKQNSAQIPIVIKLVSLVFSPDYMVPFFLVFNFWSFKRYVLISILYLVALFVKGWMGGVLYVFFAWLLNFAFHREIWPKNTLATLFLIFALILTCLPVLQFLKFYFREPSGDLIYSLMVYLSNPLSVLYLNVAETVFLRFQSVDLYFLGMNEFEIINNLYHGGYIVPSYLDNTIFYGLGLWGEGLPLGQVIASHLVGQDMPWATHPLIFGWINLEGWLFIFYFLFLTSTIFGLAHKFGGSRLKGYVLIYLVVSGWHGWISAYFSLLIYISLFFVYIRFLSIRIRWKS